MGDGKGEDGGKATGLGEGHGDEFRVGVREQVMMQTRASPASPGDHLPVTQAVVLL